MQETSERDWRNREVIRRTWRNTDGQLHRTLGPAVEHWTVLPGSGHVLSHQVWYLYGKYHREGRPAIRDWHFAESGSRVLEQEVWEQHGRPHRVRGPFHRHWIVRRDDTTLAWESWRVNGQLHRADGPAFDGRKCYWHDVEVRQKDLPWLRRGGGLLVALTGAGANTREQGDDSSAGSPTWSRDARVVMVGGDLPETYRSAVGGAVLLCV